MRCTPIMYAREMHACKLHAYEMHARKTRLRDTHPSDTRPLDVRIWGWMPARYMGVMTSGGGVRCITGPLVKWALARGEMRVGEP